MLRMVVLLLFGVWIAGGGERKRAGGRDRGPIPLCTKNAWAARIVPTRDNPRPPAERSDGARCSGTLAVMTAELDRFFAALDAEGVERARVEALLASVLEGAGWVDPTDGVPAGPPGDVLLCTTFGETLHEAVDVAVGRFTVRYPGPAQQRAAGLVCVDGGGLQARVDDLVAALLAVDAPDAAELCAALALAAARAAQPGGAFRWTGRGVAQAYEVVGEVQVWPGQIQLQAARRHDAEARIGDELWIEDRELLPVCWVLDWLRR